LFLAKKIITSFLIPPGVFISILIVSTIFSKKKTRILLCVLAFFIYFISLEPTKDFILIPLENSYPLPSFERIRACDAYLVLGSSVREGAPSLKGKGELSEEGCERVLGAFMLYSLEKRPIILTGGSIFRKEADSPYAKRLLLSLGVKERDIVVETKSRDTEENAKYAKEIAKELKIRRIVLITNAYHMRRAYILFSKYFEVTPYPVGFRTSRRSYDYLSFLPEASNLRYVASGIREYLGLAYLKFFPKG
jgi:uncharacterized SAM-binding protein YcdF (DUF218 family)